MPSGVASKGAAMAARSARLVFVGRTCALARWPLLLLLQRPPQPVLEQGCVSVDVLPLSGGWRSDRAPSDSPGWRLQLAATHAAVVRAGEVRVGCPLRVCRGTARVPCRRRDAFGRRE